MNNFREDYNKIIDENTPESNLISQTIAKMNKAENEAIVSKKPTFMFRKKAVAVLAACMIVTTISVGAYYTATRFFPNGGSSDFPMGHVFGEDESGNIAPVAPEMMEKISTNLKESAVSGNAKVTVKNIASDGNMVYINFELETLDGKELFEDSDTRKSSLYLQEFADAYIKCEGKKYEMFSIQRLDNGNIPNKASFEGAVLGDYDGENSIQKPLDINGKKVKFVLTDLLDNVTITEAIGFKYNNVAEMFDGHTAGKLKIAGVYDINDDGSKDYERYLPKGNLNIPISDEISGAYIDNFGYGPMRGENKGENLYFSVVVGSEENREKLRNIVFKDKETRVIGLPTNSTETIIEFANENKNVKFGDDRMMFEFSADDMQGANLDIDDADVTTKLLSKLVIARYTPWNDVIIGEDSEQQPILAKGKWQFEFKAKFENVSKTLKINEKIKVGKIKYSVEKIKMTPLTGVLTLKTPSPENADMIMSKLSATIRYKLKDGTEIVGNGKASYPEKIANNTYQINYRNERIVNAEDIVAISISGQDVKIK